MKKATTLFACLFTALMASASILTVSNTPALPAQYSDINAAISAATGGDTIYVHGSSFDYSGNINIDKQLVLIGPGKNPQKDIPTLAKITGYVRFQTGSDNSQLIGLYINSSIQDFAGVNNIAIIGCVVHLSVNTNSTNGSANWLIRDNIIRLDQGTVNPYAMGLENAMGLIIENNVIGGIINKGSNATFKNNVFIQNSSAFGSVFFSPSNNNLLENNIFYGVGPANCGTCTFNNNITFGAGNNNLPAGSSGSGNLINTDPQFIDAPLTVVNFNWRTFDMHLDTGSLGTAAGTDGKKHWPLRRK